MYAQERKESGKTDGLRGGRGKSELYWIQDRERNKRKERCGRESKRRGVCACFPPCLLPLALKVKQSFEEEERGAFLYSHSAWTARII